MMRREYFARRRRVAAFAAAPLAAVAVGALILFDLGPRSLDVAQNDTMQEVFRVFAVSTIGLFSLPALAVLPMLVRRSPLLVIDDEGITEGGAGLGMSAGRIRFADMRDVRVVSAGIDFLAIDLVDVDAFLQGASLSMRLTVRINLRTRYPAITIPTGIMGARAADVVAEILRAKAAASAAADADGA